MESMPWARSTWVRLVAAVARAAGAGGAKRDVFEELSRLLASRRWLDALKLIASDRLLASLVARLAPDLVRELAVLAVLAGAAPSTVERLLSEIGVGVERGILETAYRLARGDLRAALAVAPGVLRDALEAVLSLKPPGVVERLLTRLASRYPSLARLLALRYTAEMLRRGRLDSGLRRLLEKLGLRDIASRLASLEAGTASAVAEALASTAAELIAKGAIVPRGYADVLRAAERLREIAESVRRLAREAEEALESMNAERLIGVIERVVSLYREAERLAEVLSRHGVKVDTSGMKKLLASMVGSAAALLAYLVSTGRARRERIAEMARRLARAASLLSLEVAALAESLARPVSIADAVCILRKALPGFTPTLARAKRAGRLAVV